MTGLPLRNKPKIHGPRPLAELSERQAKVLRALIAAYVGQAGPVSSRRLAELMPTALSPASIRNTLSELHEMGLLDKAHASAGRVPTEVGLRIFIGDLLELGDLGPHHQRLLDRALEGVDAAETPRHASHLLSQYTRQLGFVVAPRVERQRLRSLHLVPISSERLLVVLVAENGRVIERLIEHGAPISRRHLEQIGSLLAERVAGRTLIGLRKCLEAERDALRGEADEILQQAWTLGLGACEARSEQDLVIATRRALLDQPEFSDPDRIRGLFTALETNQRLLDLLGQIANADSGEARVGLSMSLGTALGEPALRDCVLMAVPYGMRTAPDGLAAPLNGLAAPLDGLAAPLDVLAAPLDVLAAPLDVLAAPFDGLAAPGTAVESGALGVLGVIGPQRMDYGRVIPLVQYCGELVTRKLQA
jgi:heat-inducible transcriptional repressor